MFFTLNYRRQRATDDIADLFIMMTVGWKSFAWFDPPKLHRGLLARSKVREEHSIRNLVGLSLSFFDSVHVLSSYTQSMVVYKNSGGILIGGEVI
jgi:hypothetical protein